MKNDSIVKSGLQNPDDNSKDEQIHSTKDAWKDLEELFSEDPKKGSIFLGYVFKIISIEIARIFGKKLVSLHLPLQQPTGKII